MADYSTLINKLVGNAFSKQLPGLTKQIEIHYYVSAGTYDEDTDTTEPVWSKYKDITCVAAKPTMADVTDRGALFSDTKLIVPGTFIPGEPDTDTDRVIMGGKEWNIRKVVGVPGEGVWLIFVNL
jgi:hypothetical protein